MSQALCFNDVQFDVIPQNSQPWIRSPQIGGALGYANGADAVQKLYTRHADEFTDAMTAVVTLPTEGGPQEVRIFSLRGCHLLAMFARTPVAKAFRRWVLDVLDRLAEEERNNAASTPSADAPITPDQQCTLQALVKARVESLPEAERPRGLYPQIWSRFNNHFRLGSYKQLPQARLSEAVAYLTRLDIKPVGPTGPALPAGKSLEVTGVDALERLLRLRADVFRASVEVRHVLSAPFFKGPGNSETPEHQRQFAAALNEAVGGFFLAVNNNLIAAEQMFKAYVEAEKMLHQQPR